MFKALAKLRLSCLKRLASDKTLVEQLYKSVYGRAPDLIHPRTFDEKLQWYKLYYRKPGMTQVADKHRVRQFVIEKTPRPLRRRASRRQHSRKSNFLSLNAYDALVPDRSGWNGNYVNGSWGIGYNSGPDAYKVYPWTGRPYFADIHAAIADKDANGTGGLVNFFNPLDYALGGKAGSIRPWISNQNMKPDGKVTYSWILGGFYEGWSALSWPADRYAIYAFGAEAHSLPLGRQGGNGSFSMVHAGGIFDSEFDLDTDFGTANGFGDSDLSSHSAQFLSTNMWRHMYYQQLLTSMGFLSSQHWVL